MHLSYRRLLSLCTVLALAVSLPVAAGEQVTVGLDLDRLDPESLLKVIHANSEARSDRKFTVADIPLLWGFLKAVSGKMNYTRGTTRVQFEYEKQQLAAALRGVIHKLDDKTLERLAIGDGKGRAYYFLRDALVARWIEREMEKILREPKRSLVFPKEPPVMPKEMQPYGVPAADAAEYLRAVAPFWELSKSVEKSARGLGAEGTAYGKLEEIFWSGGRNGLAAELLRFEWDSWCGTGADEFEETRMQAVFLSLLRDRRLAEALGASLRFRPIARWLHAPGQPLESWRIDLARYCGLDWETLLLAGRQREVLAANVSEKAARAIMQELQTKREKKEDIYQWNELAAFLPPGRALHYPGSDVREKLPAPLQQEILAFLNEALAEDIPFHKLDENLALFARLQRMETKPVLQQLLKRPSRNYAEKAAQVLRAMSEDVPPIPPDPPVRLRFFLNGKPWPVLEMTYAIPAEEPLTGTSGYLKTDADGFAEIPRDFFLNPANTGTRFIVSCAPQNGNVWNGQEYERPWVSAECPLPRRFDETVRVDFTACPLPLEIEYFVSPNGPPRASTRIRLMKADQTGLNDRHLTLDFNGDAFAAPEYMMLTTLQPGLYRLLIAAPGSARWFSEPIDVQPGMAPLRVRLEQGSHLYASIFVPTNARGTGWYRLFRDGEDISERYPKETYDDNGPLFSGLPKGRYQLRIPSTREYMEKNQIKEWPEKQPFYTRNLREAADCEAVTVDFTIGEKTPALLDFGRIEIPAVPAMREKAGELRQITLGLDG